MEWKKVDKFIRPDPREFLPEACLLGIGNSDLLKLVRLGYRILHERGSDRDRRNWQRCHNLLQDDYGRKVWGELLHVVPA